MIQARSDPDEGRPALDDRIYAKLARLVAERLDRFVEELADDLSREPAGAGAGPSTNTSRGFAQSFLG